MTTSAALLLLFLSAPRASAHDYPIAPVDVVLRVEPDRVVADIDSDSIYWIEEVVELHPMPPRDWPADKLARAGKYVNDHLRLNADGRRLTGKLVSAEYVQRPWQVNEQGRFHLRVEYPAVGENSTLQGEADFFEDYRQERLEEKAPLLPTQDFRTFLTVDGRSSHRFELKPGAVSFSVPASEARSSAFQRFINSMGVGATTVLVSAAGWPALAALSLSLAPGAPSRRRAAGILAALFIGVAPWPGPAWTWTPWAAGLLSALAAGRRLAAVPVFEAAAAAALGRIWMFTARPWLPSMNPGPAEQGAAIAGVLCACALVLAAGLLAVNAARRRLTSISEARAGDLFERRRRLAATVLLIVCGCGLLSGLKG